MTHSPPPPPTSRLRSGQAPNPQPFSFVQGKSKIPNLLLALLIATYAVYFSWYSINRHNTLNSYAADLSLIDQPMWNTVRGPGGFMELTWGDHQQPRLAEHFEPILIPLALLFFLWDDVRILLIVQSLALALGALPVFWIAQDQLTINNEQLTNPNSQSKNPKSRQRGAARGTQASEIQNLKSKIPNWAALVFATAYLLSPHLQAANVADFHADPFAVTPLLFAFWHAGQKRWHWMWFWSAIAMLTKETLPTLTAMLGVWLIVSSFHQARMKMTNKQLRTESKIENPKPVLSEAEGSKIQNGLALIIISTIWFSVATFLIVAPLARQYFGTDGPIYFASRYSGGLAGLPSLLQDPARWRYLLGLFASVGFLPLLAPELLILGLPVLIANLTSNFPGQYSGEQHYSAPLVVAFVVAAIFGTRRLVDSFSLREFNGQSLKITALIAASLWVSMWSLGYQTLHGWTPLSARQENYRLSPAAIHLPEFTAQIPADAVVTVSAAIHPHLAHRRAIHVFPTVQEADYLLVDVTDVPGVHPNDARAKILDMLNTGWQLLRADHGLLLARKFPPQAARSPDSPLPDAFFDFARTTNPPAYPVPLTFGDGRLRLLGYDVRDDPDDGVSFRFYWQPSDTLPDNLRLWPLVYDDTGQLLSDPTRLPMVATVWYPPSAWQAGEIVVTETLPQLLPDTFHLGITVGPEGSFADPARRFPIQKLDSSEIGVGAQRRRTPTPDEEQSLQQASRLFPGHWAQLATFRRQGPFLEQLPATPTLQTLTPTDVRFGPAIHLIGFWFGDSRPRPGETVPVVLQWMADRPPQADFTVFIHLLAGDGRLVAQSDAFPTWLAPAPTSQWPLNRPLLDRHTLSLPPGLPAGRYTLQVGLYDAQTMERLPLPDGSDAFLLGQVQVK